MAIQSEGFACYQSILTEAVNPRGEQSTETTNKNIGKEDKGKVFIGQEEKRILGGRRRDNSSNFCPDIQPKCE